MAKENPKRPPVKTSFKKGEVANPTGRPIGITSLETQAKRFITKKITDIKDLFDEDGLSQLITDIDSLPLKERIQAKLTLLEYVKPKLGRIEVAISKEQEIIAIFGKPIEQIDRPTPDDIEDIEHEDIDNSSDISPLDA